MSPIVLRGCWEGFQGHGRKAHRDQGLAFRLPFAGRDNHLQLTAHRLPAHHLPEPPHFRLTDRTVLGSPHQQLGLQGAGLVKQRKKIRLAVADGDKLCLGGEQRPGSGAGP